jgi:Spy/CpxP family protein refolding chaperone
MPGLHHPIWDDLAAVGLDAKQKQALDGIRNGVTKSVIRKTADLRIARIETHEALAGDTVNIKTVEEKVRTAAALRADIELSVIRAIEEAKALLTPAQRTRLNELRKAGGMPGSAHVRPPARPGKKDGPAARAEKG